MANIRHISQKLIRGLVHSRVLPILIHNSAVILATLHRKDWKILGKNRGMITH